MKYLKAVINNGKNATDETLLLALTTNHVLLLVLISLFIKSNPTQ
jgi:hypothetical protein